MNLHHPREQSSLPVCRLDRARWVWLDEPADQECHALLRRTPSFPGHH